MLQQHGSEKSVQKDVMGEKKHRHARKLGLSQQNAMQLFEHSSASVCQKIIYLRNGDNICIL